MAGEWIKMRVTLRKHPKTIAIARFLAQQRDFMDFWCDPIRKTVSQNVTEIVTLENVTRVVVCGLLEVWGAINQTVKGDLRVPYMRLEDLDGIAGLPSFGHAMELVGWVREFSNERVEGLVFPNFSEHNTPEHDRSTAKTQAERASEYRARKKAEKESVTVVTKRHAPSRIEEKRREDIKAITPIPPFEASETDLLGEHPGPKKSRSRRGGMTFAAWMESLPHGSMAIPSTDAVFTFADKSNIPRPFLRLAWIAFEAAMTERKVVKKDWPAHFRNAVKGDWFKLWRFNQQGECYLTTAGKMLEANSAEADA